MFSTRKHFNLHEWSRSWSRTVNLDSSIRIDIGGGGDAFCIPASNQRAKIGPRGRVSPASQGLRKRSPRCRVTNYRSPTCVHESSSLRSCEIKVFASIIFHPSLSTPLLPRFFFSRVVRSHLNHRNLFVFFLFTFFVFNRFLIVFNFIISQ